MSDHTYPTSVYCRLCLHRFTRFQIIFGVIGSRSVSIITYIAIFLTDAAH